MKGFFKPEDFHEQKHLTYVEAANIANRKLNALIESWPVVLRYEEGITSYWNTEDVLGRPDNPTHKARLAFIEPTVKDPCKHELDINDVNPSKTKGTCKHCGVELIAEWKVK